jgi:hypothetical protein
MMKNLPGTEKQLQLDDSFDPLVETPDRTTGLD